MANHPYSIAVTRTLKADPRRIFEVIENIEDFPNFMPKVNKLTLLASEGNHKVAEWDTMIDDAPLVWVQEDIYDREQMLVRFRAVEGVFDRFEGTWQVNPAGEGAEVKFELVYEIGLPEIEEIIAPILRSRMIENAEGMLAAIEKRSGRDDE